MNSDLKKKEHYTVMLLGLAWQSFRKIKIDSIQIKIFLIDIKQVLLFGSTQKAVELNMAFYRY